MSVKNRLCLVGWILLFVFHLFTPCSAANDGEDTEDFAKNNDELSDEQQKYIEFDGNQIVLKSSTNKDRSIDLYSNEKKLGFIVERPECKDCEISFSYGSGESKLYMPWKGEFFCLSKKSGCESHTMLKALSDVKVQLPTGNDKDALIYGDNDNKLDGSLTTDAVKFEKTTSGKYKIKFQISASDENDQFKFRFAADEYDVLRSKFPTTPPPTTVEPTTVAVTSTRVTTVSDEDVKNSTKHGKQDESNNGGTKKSGAHWKTVVIVSGAVLICILFLLTLGVVYYFCINRKKHDKSDEETATESVKADGRTLSNSKVSSPVELIDSEVQHPNAKNAPKEKKHKKQKKGKKDGRKKATKAAETVEPPQQGTNAPQKAPEPQKLDNVPPNPNAAPPPKLNEPQGSKQRADKGYEPLINFMN